MTYWHMQLHPNDLSWKRERELLKKKSLIGLGMSDSKLAYTDFKSMKLDDVVLIKHGANPIALVKVVGEIEDIKNNDFTRLDWFKFRRKVEILEILDENRYDFPSPRGTLKKSINKYSLTYQYIDELHKKTQNKNIFENGIKLLELHIDSYKLFKDFSINFVDNNRPLPIVVIAGKNGTGKTSLFEYLYKDNFLNIGAFYGENSNYIKVIQNGKTKTLNNIAKKTRRKIDNISEKRLIENGISAINIPDNSLYLDEIEKNIIYLPARTPNEEEINSLDRLVLDYIDYFIYEKSLTAAIGYENLQNDIDEIFEGFELSFQFKRIDSKNKKALFEPFIGSRDDIEFSLKSLSTGEKTLLFKILNLYLKQAKNKVILIDEPELSLHPHWQNRVLQVYERFAKINNNQIIIATHSPHIIASAKPEYLRILRKKDDGRIEVIDKYSKSYGLEFNKVLLEIMDMNETRTPEVEKELRYIKKQIYSNKFLNDEEFFKRWNELEDKIGSDDLDMKLLKFEMHMREKKNVSDK